MRNFMYLVAILVTLPIPLISAIILLFWIGGTQWAKKTRDEHVAKEALLDRVSKDYAEQDAIAKQNEVPFWRANKEQ